ncbi:hypothetical protein ACLB2K_037794 [Fragaria x ananassa]
METVEELNCIYRNPNESVEARVKDLLSRMTLKEKVGQMTQLEREVATPFAIKDLSIGSIISGAGSEPFKKALSADWADMVDGFQRDADLAQRIGEATALEVRASSIHYTFAPCVAVCRDPRWGRCYESYSEDTEIVRKMTSIISGLQGKPPQGHENGYPFIKGRNNTIACAKHFVGDGGTKKGVNEGNTISSYYDSERIHMAPYLWTAFLKEFPLLWHLIPAGTEIDYMLIVFS